MYIFILSRRTIILNLSRFAINTDILFRCLLISLIKNRRRAPKGKERLVRLHGVCYAYKISIIYDTKEFFFYVASFPLQVSYSVIMTN